LLFNRKTKNRLGTIFGGSISALVDPFYMFMLIKILGPDDDEIDAIRRELRTGRKSIAHISSI